MLDMQKLGPAPQQSPPRDADAFDGVIGKFEQHFSTNAGQGD